MDGVPHSPPWPWPWLQVPAYPSKLRPYPDLSAVVSSRLPPGVPCSQPLRLLRKQPGWTAEGAGNSRALISFKNPLPLAVVTGN